MKNYRLIEERFNSDINSKICYYEHIASGARVLTISNDDNNKVFSVGFRTPPTNDTGVPHILEHSTLCGSKKYPVKDPFVELLKGSLNTFLNAVTFPDKTVYPVASCNDKDFANLMGVYLDAVFYPNVYAHPEIFKQEGWHYELEDKDGEIIYNGVVYNEMKGAFSSPDQVVYRQCMHTAFPDTAYGVESGGDPLHIPELSYEEFLNFHSKYYHPANSYIYLYGDMDMEERLQYLDEEYLSKFSKISVDSELKIQKPFDKPVHSKLYYPVGKEESLEDKTYYAYNAVIGKAGNNLLNTAFGVISYVLFDAPGAPLKLALLDAGIGKDISSSYESGILQPLFSIVAKDAKSGKLEEFEALIKREIEKVVNEGVDKKSILAALNFLEFQYREADFGGLPKGLVYNFNTLDNWLYDDSDPFSKLEGLKVFKELRDRVGTSYYEDLLREYFLENNHVSILEVAPSNTLGEENDAKIKAELAKYKESLSDEEIEKLIEETRELKIYQATPSTKEELDTLPKLTRDDISEDVIPYKNDVLNIDGVTVLNHDIFTNGISYLKLCFNFLNVPNDLMPYVGLLSTCLGYMDTTNYKYADITKEVMLNTGGISSSAVAYNVHNDECLAYFMFGSKYVSGKEQFVFDMILEQILNTDFSSKKRLAEIIAEEKSRRQMGMLSRGHLTASMHALSYFNKQARINELVDGIDYYSFIENLNANFNDVADDVVAKLNKVAKIIFRKENLVVSCTTQSHDHEAFIADFANKLFSEPIEKTEFKFEENDLAEGFKTSSTVNFTGMALSYEGKANYTGALQVFGMALRYDYMWSKLRVLGGAYGSLARLNKDGYILFGSYRDPKLLESYKVYDEIIDFIDQMEYSDEDVTKFIIGAIGMYDSPMTPAQEGERSTYAYLRGQSIEVAKKERREIINTTLADLKALKELFVKAFEKKYVCTIGNENKLEESKDFFKTVKNLYK